MIQDEHKLQNKIKLWCGEHNLLCFHANVGGGRLENGSYFSSGLPKGFSDLLIFTNDGKTIFCETKVGKNKPTKEQLNFISQMQQRGFKAFVAYSLEEFVYNISDGKPSLFLKTE